MNIMRNSINSFFPLNHHSIQHELNKSFAFPKINSIKLGRFPLETEYNFNGTNIYILINCVKNEHSTCSPLCGFCCCFTLNKEKKFLQIYGFGCAFIKKTILLGNWKYKNTSDNIWGNSCRQNINETSLGRSSKQKQYKQWGNFYSITQNLHHVLANTNLIRDYNLLLCGFEENTS